MELTQKLALIQKELKAPKNQYNSFGRYKYRSCEDILTAVKPLLEDILIILKDEVVLIGNRFYVKAIVSLTDGDKFIETTAYAREEEDKKGMDGSQITGAASSYARKYALNGLFAIDDNKDSDKTSEAKQPVRLNEAVVKQIAEAKNLADLNEICAKAKVGKSADYVKSLVAAYTVRKEELGGEI